MWILLPSGKLSNWLSPKKMKMPGCCHIKMSLTIFTIKFTFPVNIRSGSVATVAFIWSRMRGCRHPNITGQRGKKENALANHLQGGGAGGSQTNLLIISEPKAWFASHEAPKIKILILQISSRFLTLRSEQVKLQPGSWLYREW